MTDESSASATTRQRRKRKWDQPSEAVVSAGLLPGLLPFTGTGAFAGMGSLQGFPSLLGVLPNLTASMAPPIIPQLSSSSLVQQSAAAAIVQKFNQDLMNKGLTPQAKIQDELIAREIAINDAEPGVRYKLTKRQTQEEIQVKTGAVVITRGRYRPPNGPVEPEKPLYLHISAGVHLKDTAERIRAVDQAAAMVEELLKQGRQTSVSSSVPSAGTISNGTASAPFAATVYVGFEADPSFNLLGRIRGPNDQYINHIMNETGATVTLRGRGSGNRCGPSGEELPQPLHLYITCDSPKNLQDAKVLAENLLQTIRSPVYPPVPGPTPPVVVQGSSPYPTLYSEPYQTPSYTATGLAHIPYGGYHVSATGTHLSPYAGSRPPFYSPMPAGAAPLVVQSAPVPINGADLYANRIPPSKVYTAVPPPVQLLGEQSGVQTTGAGHGSLAQDADQNSVTEPFPTSSGMYSGNVSTSPSQPAQSTFYTAFRTASSASTASSQSAFKTPSLPSIGGAQGSQPSTFPSSYGQSQVSSYSGYSGVYPQASPLQQVAQALQRPPPPVSQKVGSTSAFTAEAPTKAQTSFTQDKQPDKQQSQRRKFQEFPVSAGKGASGAEKHGRRIISSSVEPDSKAFQEPGPSSSIFMPPPSTNLITPSPQKASATKSAVSTPLGSDSIKRFESPATVYGKQPGDNHASPPRTGLKLVEYCEEEEESSDHGASPSSSNGLDRPSISNGKPFWAA